MPTEKEIGGKCDAKKCWGTDRATPFWCDPVIRNKCRGGNIVLERRDHLRRWCLNDRRADGKPILK